MTYVPLATLMPPASPARRVAFAIIAGPAAMPGFHATSLCYDLTVRFRKHRARA